ncbi:MAG: hypothetical protein ACR2OG_00765 [Gemmatimonadaceae bacterium]
MTLRPRSLKHEYELYVEREIEEYKDSVPRQTILAIGDEAVVSLADQDQLALTEILLCGEVDRLIRQRLRLPSLATWRRRRLKALKDFSRPEYWGLRPDGAIARAATSAAEGHVLIAGATEEGPTLYLAANGCTVTTLDSSETVVERVIGTAARVGLTSFIHGLVADLSSWTPDMPLNAVVCATAAFDGLTVPQRSRAIGLLQQATTVGGVHIVATATENRQLPTIEELEQSYRGWRTSVERDVHSRETFLAWKAVA